MFCANLIFLRSISLAVLFTISNLMKVQTNTKNDSKEFKKIDRGIDRTDTLSLVRH